MKQLVREVKITGTGSYLPEKVITNKYLESTIDTNADWIYENLGIKERRIAADNQATSDLASNAALNAIENAGLVVSDIDLIIVATATPDRLAPSTAAIVQDKIKAYNAVAFDIAAVCSGFLYGMSVASQYIATSVYDNVLVIGADTFSRITDWSRRDAVFFLVMVLEQQFFHMGIWMKVFWPFDFIRMAGANGIIPFQPVDQKSHPPSKVLIKDYIIFK